MLPDAKDSFDDVLKLVSEHTIDDLVKYNKLQTRSITLQISKFKFEYESKVNDVIKILGAKDGLEHSANISKEVDDDNLYVSEVTHKTFFEMNEKGIKVTAATWRHCVKHCKKLDEKILNIPHFTIDSPFVFMIKHKNLSLFMAKVTGFSEH